jgi:hypothetical protein
MRLDFLVSGALGGAGALGADDMGPRIEGGLLSSLTWVMCWDRSTGDAATGG